MQISQQILRLHQLGDDALRFAAQYLAQKLQQITQPLDLDAQLMQHFQRGAIEHPFVGANGLEIEPNGAGDHMADQDAQRFVAGERSCACVWGGQECLEVPFELAIAVALQKGQHGPARRVALHLPGQAQPFQSGAFGLRQTGGVALQLVQQHVQVTHLAQGATGAPQVARKQPQGVLLEVGLEDLERGAHTAGGYPHIVQRLDVFALARAFFLAQHTAEMKIENFAPCFAHTIVAAHAGRAAALVANGGVGHADCFAGGQGQLGLAGAGQRQGNCQLGARLRGERGKGRLQGVAAGLQFGLTAVLAQLDLYQPHRFIGRVEKDSVQRHFRDHALACVQLAHMARLLNVHQLFQRVAGGQRLSQGARGAFRPGIRQSGGGEGRFNLGALMETVRLFRAAVQTFERGQPGAIGLRAQATGETGLQKIVLGGIEVDILAASHAFVVQGEITQAFQRQQAVELIFARDMKFQFDFLGRG